VHAGELPGASGEGHTTAGGTPHFHVLAAADPLGPQLVRALPAAGEFDYGGPLLAGEPDQRFASLGLGQ
jgi:hypothetical protein